MSTPLKWAQISHSILLAPFMIFAALSDSYLIRLESGESMDIAAHHGLLGQMLLWSVISIYAVQVLSFWRLSTLTVWVYSWFGTWLLLMSILIATSGDFLSQQVQNLSSLGQWLIDVLGINFSLESASIEVGNAWILIFGAALSMIGLAIWMFIEKYSHYTFARKNS
jgi:hypothetical protein